MSLCPKFYLQLQSVFPTTKAMQRMCAMQRERLLFSLSQRQKTNFSTPHFFHANIGYNFVVIDGNSYGKGYAVQAWYDEKKNAFVWTAVEDRELVVYEYKLNWKILRHLLAQVSKVFALMIVSYCFCKFLHQMQVFFQRIADNNNIGSGG